MQLVHDYVSFLVVVTELENVVSVSVETQQVSPGTGYMVRLHYMAPSTPILMGYQSNQCLFFV